MRTRATGAMVMCLAASVLHAVRISTFVLIVLRINQMSRSQYGARKAIAGTMAACRRADEACAEGVRRFDACQTMQDVRGVLDWMQLQSFFFASQESDDLMRAAFERARQRVAVQPE